MLLSPDAYTYTTGAAANILGVPVTPKVQAHPERANQLKLMYRQVWTTEGFLLATISFMTDL